MKDEQCRLDIDNARSGDRGAIDRLLTRTRKRLEGIAERSLGAGMREKTAVSDIMQSAYLQVVRDLEEFRGNTDDAFVAWVGRILENTVRRKRRYFSAQKRSDSSDATTELARRRRPITTPPSAIGRAEDIVLVGRALERLQEDYRRIIVMRVVDELTHEQIAAQMDRSVSAAKMLLSRARAALSLELESLSDEG